MLSRYLIRQVTAPFVYAVMAVTSLLLLKQIGERFGDLVGKDLPWTIIAEVFALSLPFIMAQAVPMAVLIAVLHAFSRLATDNEITAMRASGLSVYQILRPMLLWGGCMAALSFVIIDQVVPRTNAKLWALRSDIAQKRVTFALREEVINEIPPSPYFLRAGRIEPSTGRLRDVTIYDVGGGPGRRVIYADSGLMGYAQGRKDLALRLYNGTIHQAQAANPALFQLTRFSINEIRVRDVADAFERHATEGVLGDRTMSIQQMLAVIREAETERAAAERRRQDLLEEDLIALLGRGADRAVRLADWGEVVGAADRADAARRQAARYWVEIHKKWSISAACLSFVIIGIVLALRFPGGGMGLVLGGGGIIFSVYHIGLTSGETLADRRLIASWVAMWWPNIVIAGLGALGLLWVNREPGSTRGDGLQEIIDGFRRLGRRAARPPVGLEDAGSSQYS